MQCPLSLLVPHAVMVKAGLPAVPAVVHSLDQVGLAESYAHKDRLRKMVSYVSTLLLLLLS
jgi:hypothetical protein